MYKRLRDGLVDPKKIVNYISDKMIMPILMILLFALILVAPTVYSLVTFQVPYEVKSDLKEAFKNESLPYKIENGQLVCYDTNLEKDTKKTVGAVTIAFLNAKITNQGAIVIRFNEENITIEYLEVKFRVVDYLELEKLEGLDFKLLSEGDDEAWSKIFTSMNELYSKNKSWIATFGSIYAFISNATMLVFVAMLFALGSLFRMHNIIKFSSIFKMCVYCLAPFTVFTLISDLTSLNILFYIGAIISLVYITIAQAEIFKKIYSHHTEE